MEKGTGGGVVTGHIYRLSHATWGAEMSGRLWRVVGGWCGRLSGGRLFAPVEEVGSGYKREGLQLRTLLMGRR